MMGDVADFYDRLLAAVPSSWFGDDHPTVDALLNGMGDGFAGIYDLYTYSAEQTRLQTTVDEWLDAWAFDFFAYNLTRNSGELNADFRLRVENAMFGERATRASVIAAIEGVTGNTPAVCEFWFIPDTGSYGRTYYSAGSGKYGSRTRPYQATVAVTGYSGPHQAVYDAINSTKVYGTVVWTAFL